MDALENEWQDLFGSSKVAEKESAQGSLAIVPIDAAQRMGDPQMVQTAEKAKNHSSHQSCDPCTMICPFCAKQMLLSGMMFHMAQCKELLLKRAEAASGSQESILRMQYPYSIYMADKASNGQYMSDESFGALVPKRKGDVWGATMVQSESQHIPTPVPADESSKAALPSTADESVATLCVSLELELSLLPSPGLTEQDRKEWLQRQVIEQIKGGRIDTLQQHNVNGRQMVDVEIEVRASAGDGRTPFLEQAESRCRAFRSFDWVKSVFFVSFLHGSSMRVPLGSHRGKSGQAVKAAIVPRRRRRIVDSVVSRTRREKLAAQPFTSKAVLSLADEDRNRIHDHSQHYTCHPCTIKCRTCPLGVVIWGYAFHVQHCANKAEAIERLDPDSLAVSMSIEQAVRSQYPLSDNLLNQTSSLPASMALNQRRRHWRKFDPIEPIKEFAEEEEDASDIEDAASAITSTPASRKAGLRCLQLQKLETHISRRQGQRQHGSTLGEEDGTQSTETENVDRVVAGSDTPVPGKNRAAALWAKAGKRIVAARVFASHTGHYSCNPCSMQCPHCEVPVLLAGLDFHKLACKKLTEKRVAITEGTMEETVRSVFPLSGSLLDSYWLTDQGAAEQARNQRRRQRWKGTKRTLVGDGGGDSGLLPHSKHYSCNPCSITCAGCEKAVLLAGFAQHQKSCAHRHQQHQDVTSEQRSMATAVHHQYPASARVLDVDAQKEAVSLRAHKKFSQLQHRREKKSDQGAGKHRRSHDPDKELKHQHSCHKQCHPCVVECPDCKVQVLVNSFPNHLKKCSFKTSEGRARKEKEQADHQDTLNKQILETLQRYLFLAKCKGASVERRRAALEDWLTLVRKQEQEQAAGGENEESLDIGKLLLGQEAHSAFKAPLHALHEMLAASVLRTSGS
jgi:hypothetical protein